ncbi:hypothetical protein DL764_005896 [Monosporascus ibericus]|uniref:AA1-like domain-containing protein n=1 Tax=Monosporascus ibericus TaxID=155417 RepID=A0A4Q4T722_9PEZI|nr:hypothetical protein DL764_005896 [Monosporascus ibericus]
MAARHHRALGLLQAVALFGISAAFSPPAGHDTPMCAAISENFINFQLQGFEYRVPDPPETARLTFNITHSATRYTSQCDMEGPELAPGAGGSGQDIWVPCGDVSESTGISGEYCDLKTYVLFERDSERLVINQTWYCDDVTPEYPIAFTGTADYVVANLTCSSSDQYLEECTAPSARINIWQWGRDDLLPNALECPLNATQTTRQLSRTVKT